MTDEQLFMQAAELMGWRVTYQVCDGWCGIRDGVQDVIPRYTTSRNAAGELEKAVEKAGRQREYVAALCRIDGVADLFNSGGKSASLHADFCRDIDELCWRFARFTPRQRGEAFIEAMKGPSK